MRPLNFDCAARALERVFRIEVAQLAEIEPCPLLDLTQPNLVGPELAEHEFEPRHEVALAQCVGSRRQRSVVLHHYNRFPEVERKLEATVVGIVGAEHGAREDVDLQSELARVLQHVVF